MNGNYLQQISTIAKNEVFQKQLLLNKRIVIGFLLFMIAISTLGFFAPVTSVDSGIYTVGVEQDSKYYPAIEQHSSTRAVPLDKEAFENKEIDVLIYSDGSVDYHPSGKSQAALVESHEAINKYNERQFGKETNIAAAFPVLVNIIPTDEVATVQESTQDDSTDTNTDSSNSDDSTSDSSNSETSQENVEKLQNIEPPLPFESVILGLFFLVPFTFLIQSYASSLFDEQLTGMNDVLLTTPINITSFVIGKTLPYLIITGIISLALMAATNTWSILLLISMFVIGVCFLSTGFLVSILARSYRELTFLLLTVSILLMSLFVIPALFTGTLSIAFISPLSIIIAQLQGTSVTLTNISMSLIPTAIVGLIIYAFCIISYDYITLDNTTAISMKFTRILSQPQNGLQSLLWMQFVILPFVFILELLSLSLIFIVPSNIALYFILGTLAMIEEVAKSLPVVSGLKHSIYDNTITNATIGGIISGFSFFMAEKVFVAVQYAGFLDKNVGVVFSGFGELFFTSPLFFILWISFHSLMAIIPCNFSRYGKRWYIIGLFLAVGIHSGYNYAVMTLMS